MPQGKDHLLAPDCLSVLSIKVHELRGRGKMRFNSVASSVLLVALVCCGIMGSSARLVKHGDLCYYFSSIAQSTPWSSAYQRCKAMGAILARVESEDVNKFIKSVIPSRFQAHWIGVFENYKSPVYEMVYSDDMQPIVYSNYATGHPKYECTFLRARGSTMTWFTGNSNHMYQYICQKPC